ncbi:hypothetical protein SUGI_0683720 [Cryptomeria japonica]|nr:hypothetical protein SUGI_0683720 [Cryptomeria japonica]
MHGGKAASGASSKATFAYVPTLLNAPVSARVTAEDTLFPFNAFQGDPIRRAGANYTSSRIRLLLLFSITVGGRSDLQPIPTHLARQTINQTGVMNASVLSKLEVMLCGLEAVSLVKSTENPEAAARKLTEIAFNKGSANNITCVVRFNHGKDDSP